MAAKWALRSYNDTPLEHASTIIIANHMEGITNYMLIDDLMTSIRILSFYI